MCSMTGLQGRRKMKPPEFQVQFAPCKQQPVMLASVTTSMLTPLVIGNRLFLPLTTLYGMEVLQICRFTVL